MSFICARNGKTTCKSYNFIKERLSALFSIMASVSFVFAIRIILASKFIHFAFAESFTFEVKDTAVLPCYMSVPNTDVYWFFSGGAGSDVRMYLSRNDQAYDNHVVTKRFGNRITVDNDTSIGLSFDLRIRNLSFSDIGEYRCGFLDEQRVIKWVHVHQLNVSERGVYDVECAVHGPLKPKIGSTVEFFCEIPPQSIYPQKQVELIWYKDDKPLFTSSGLFAPSLAVRLQRTLIESDFGAKFACLAYDDQRHEKGQCIVSAFHFPANVTIRLLSSQGDISAGSDLRLICVADGFSLWDGGDDEWEFSWHLGSRRIFPDPLPSERDESTSTPLGVNNVDWTFENGGEMLTFHRYHSDINGSVVTCSVRSREGIMSSAPFVVYFPPGTDGDIVDNTLGGSVSGSPNEGTHDEHYFTIVLAILAFVGGVVLAVCIIAFLTVLKQRRRSPGPVGELRWMPIQNTVVDYRTSETVVKRHYIKPPKRLNVHERFKRRSGGDFPIASEHAQQICIRNKLNCGKKRRDRLSVSDDMYNFPLSYNDIPEFRRSRSNVLPSVSRSSSLGDLHLVLSSGKPHYVNLPSEYSVPFRHQKKKSHLGKACLTPERLTLEDFRLGVGLPHGKAEVNGKADTTIAYAELDLDYLKAMEGTAPVSREEGVTYAEISIPGQSEDHSSVKETSAEGNSPEKVNLI